MILPELIRNYRERNWKCYEMTQGEAMAIPSEAVTDKDLTVCDSEGGMAIGMAKTAEKLKTVPNWLLLDMELVAAGLDPLIGSFVYRLTEPWRGHRAGALVIRAFTGYQKTPMTNTVCVETD